MVMVATKTPAGGWAEKARTTQIDKLALRRSACEDSFYYFVKEFWSEVTKEKPVWNWHIKYICDELQYVMEKVFRGEPKEYDVVLNVPPGSTKTTIASIMLPAWCWTRMASFRTIGASYEDGLARDNARKGRNIIKSEKYRTLWPHIKLRDDQDAKGYYENTEGGDRNSVGSEGMITGKHAHAILIDDPINPKGARSENEIKTISTWIDETLSTRMVDKAVSVIILIMQRLHQEDPSGKMLQKSQAHPEEFPVKHICLPCDDQWPILPARLKKYYTKDEETSICYLDPKRISRTICKKQEVILGPYGYAGQFGQQPAPLGGGMFKVEKINCDLPAPPLYKFRRLIRYWDKAGTKDGDGAETAGVLMGEMWDPENKVASWWVLDVIHGRWDSGSRELLIKSQAKMDGPRVAVGVEQEPGSGGKESAEGTVKRLAGSSVYVDRPRGDKVQRADPFSVQVNIGNVFVPKGAVWWNDYKAQLQLFPNAKLKDMVDASSGAFASLNNRVRIGGHPAGNKPGNR